MPIHTVGGDLFVDRFGTRALTHGCNCQGAMGAGIAFGFRERYPIMFVEYRQRCITTPRAFNPGDCLLWKEAAQPWVFNLTTQEHYWRDHATYPVVEAALEARRRTAEAEQIRSIAMPRIVVSHSGWRTIRTVIEQVLAGWPGKMRLYEEYQLETECTG